MLVMVTLIPFFGALSDHIGRKPILVTALVLYLVLIYPLFVWLNNEPSLTRLIVVELVCCILLAAYYGVFAAVVAELFPIAIRSSGLGISYNISVMIFGGFGQFIVTCLIETLHTPIAITYYLMGAVFISLIAAICYKDNS
jgi:MFS family permease